MIELNPTSKAKLLHHLQQHLPNGCVVCGGKNAQMKYVYNLTHFDPRSALSVVAGAPVEPVIQVTCGACANVTFWNAVGTGVLDPSGNQA